MKNNSLMIKRIGYGILFVIVAFIASFMLSKLNKYYILIINNAIIYFIAALGITLMLGMCGQVTFSAVAFMGISGFTATVLCTKFGVNTLLALTLGIITSTLIAYALGRLLLRLKGLYFAFATIGIAQIFSTFFTNWKWLSGGPDGTTGIPKLDIIFITMDSSLQWTYLLIIVAILCGLLIERIRRTYLGRAASSIRDNEIVAATMGVDVYRIKVKCFTISSCLAAIAGGLLVFHNQYAVESMFSYDLSINYLLMVMLGGVNSTAGTLVGSVLLTLLPEVLRSMQRYLRLIYGIAIILIMTFMPMGLAGLYKDLQRKCKNIKIGGDINEKV